MSCKLYQSVFERGQANKDIAKIKFCMYSHFRYMPVAAGLLGPIGLISFNMIYGKKIGVVVKFQLK